jgi:hypothetical protein
MVRVISFTLHPIRYKLRIDVRGLSQYLVGKVICQALVRNRLKAMH